ncbi:intermembrane phospholipid transport protein YdbH family protein [Kangiella sp.]|uniref:intermembrane phospholipid transport protein YdbH family protein n=1 Tax=Kangiella sp. TaxID=1920245 RepID=UPI003A8CE480
MIKKILKWIAWISASLALLLLIAYWTSPYWVPGQLAKFLPPSIKLESLDLERPGLTRTKVKHLTLQIDGPNTVAIELNNTELRYSLWRQKLLDVSAEKAIIKLSSSEEKPSNASFQLPQTINLPHLPIDQLSIEQVELQGFVGQNFQISDIQFKADDNELRLNSQIAWMSLNFDLAAKIQHSNQSLELLDLKVQQNDNQLTLSASPLSQSGWQLDLSGEIEQIPFIQIYSADLDTISFDLATTIQQTADKQFVATLQANSRLEIPVQFNPAWFEQEVPSYAKEYGLTLDMQKLDKKVTFELVARDDTQLDLNLETQSLKANGQLELTANNKNLQTTTSIDSIHLDLAKTTAASEQTASAHIIADLNLPKISYHNTVNSFNSSSLKAHIDASAHLQDGNLQLKSQQLNLNLDNSILKGKGYTVNLPTHQWQGAIDWTQNLTTTLSEPNKAQASTATVKKLSLKLVKPIDLKLALNDETVSANQFAAQINLTNNIFKANYSANEFSLSKQPLKLRKVKGSLSPDATNAAINGALEFDQASYLTDNIAVDYVSGKFDWKLLKQSFTAKGSLLQSQNTIPIRYVYKLKTGEHDLQIDRSSLPMLTLKSWTPFLNAYPALQVTGGDLNIKKVSGDPLKLLFEGNLSINDLSLLYDKLALNKATITDNLSKQSSLQGSVNAKVDSIQIAAGIAITNLNLKLEHTATDYRFHDISGQLLGGTISIPRFDMHKTSIKPFTLMLSSINLQKLLSALESEKLSVTSDFDIILPLIIKPDSRQITNGTFISKKPGVLKLKTDAAKQANIAFRAMENFHYKELSGTIDYSSEGDYTITLYTLGSNPDVYNGFPIKLDLTLRGNLPNLLYSMLITGDMATPVLDDLKQKDLLKIQ